MNLVTLYNLFIVVTISKVNNAYRILGVFPFNGPSHHIMFQELMKILAQRGHQVDVVSEFPLQHPFPNYTDIPFESYLPKLKNNFTLAQVREYVTSTVDFVALIAGNTLCERLGSPSIQNLVKSPPNNPPYDLLITEVFGSHCYMAIGHVLNIPVIGVSSADLYPWLHQLVAAPQDLALFPNTVIVKHIQHMNFWWRLYNTVYTVYNVVRFNYLTRVQDEIIHRHLGPNVPRYSDVISDVGLILVNSHISMTGIRTTTPALIDVGGLHINEESPQLSKDVKMWLDDSPGFVYFSFGSMVKIESLSKETLHVFYNSLKKISPIRVLMKIAAPEELPPNLPANVITSNWLVQTTVLKHPKVKAFITHGGLLSTQEAIYFGVPMIGIPLFADQTRNVHMGVQKNITIYLDIDNLKEKDLDTALKEILNNPIYRESAKRMSRAFRDRPQSAADTAYYWVKYIIRHGSKALRSPAMDMPWWQVALIDVYIFLLSIVILIMFLLFVLFRLTFKLIKDDDRKISDSKKYR